MRVYNGQAAKNVDHVARMPTAWRLQRYLDADVDNDKDIGQASLQDFCPSPAQLLLTFFRAVVNQVHDMQAYNGQVAKDVNHEALMPAAWRLDRYLDADVDDDEDISMASLRGHRLTYDKSQQRDDMARNDNVDDLKVSQVGGRALHKQCSHFPGRPLGLLHHHQ